jgi:ABC-2 type transport system ATP-binding protein
MGAMIEIKNLEKRFGDITAVAGVSFNVERGEVLGFLGPNGAGKSTTMKMITGFLDPSGGTALVGGHDITADALAAKRLLGYLPEGAPLYPDMTPESFLHFIAGVRGYSGEEARRRVSDVVAKVSLQGVLRQPIETLSKGFKRRVGLAQAILHDPQVLVLDEPLSGLDAHAVVVVKEVLTRLAAAGKTILYSSHVLDVVERICDRIALIDGGAIVASGTFDELQARARGGSLENIVTDLTSAGEHAATAARIVAALRGDAAVA